MDKLHVREWSQIRLSSEQVESVKQKIESGYKKNLYKEKPSSNIRLGSVFVGIAGLTVFMVFLVLFGRLWIPVHRQEATNFIQPDYSILKQVPEAQVSSVKGAIRDSGIKNMELPTWLPYKVKQAHVPNGAVIDHHITIYLGNASETLSIDARVSGTNSTTTMMNSQTAHLPGGTKALYGTNGTISELAWVENGVSYILSSSKQGNVPDLSESELIRVAESFK